MPIKTFLYSYLTFGGWFEHKAKKALQDLDDELVKIKNDEETPFKIDEIELIKEAVNNMIKYKSVSKYESYYPRHLSDCGDLKYPLTKKLFKLYNFYTYFLW